MIYVIIAFIAFFFLGLSLCIAAGRADESAERLERKLSLGRLVRGKRNDNAPAVPNGRRLLSSNFTAPEIRLN